MSKSVTDLSLDNIVVPVIPQDRANDDREGFSMRRLFNKDIIWRAKR